MTAQIATLIDKQDTIELVRDAIAVILLEESTAQQALAVTAGKDPLEWKLRVYTENAKPWTQWLTTPSQDHIDATPIVVVAFERDNVDKRRSDLFARQQSDAQFNIDVFGYGISTATDVGHTLGDSKASQEAHRAARLVRNILMAPNYVELGMPSTVAERMIESRQRFPPELFEQNAQNVAGMRLVLGVNLEETVGQIAGTACTTIVGTVYRAEDGEILFTITRDFSG